MSNQNTDERQCRHCGAPSFLWRGLWLCARHHRYVQMRKSARADGKVDPTYEQLDAMPGSNMVCPTCDIKMNWTSKEGGRASVASLQHYRDGTLAIVCVACNTRHKAMPADEYRDLPKGHKRCPRCSETKPLDAFYMARWKGNPTKITSFCKKCLASRRRDYYRVSIARAALAAAGA